MWGSIRRLLHAGAALRWEVGLSRDRKGRGGVQGLQPEPVCLRTDGTESGGVQPLCWQAGVLPSDGEVQLPAVLCRRQRREGLHRVPAWDLSLRQ